jgi:hypothetical protein
VQGPDYYAAPLMHSFIHCSSFILAMVLSIQTLIALIVNVLIYLTFFSS